MTGKSHNHSRRAAQLLSLVGIVLLAACAARNPPPDQIYDPYEGKNREVHELNKKIDRLFLRPIARGYGSVVPEPVQNGIRNFSENLALPGVVVNDLLQLNIDDALHNATRFLFNSTLGLGGILDPSDGMGLYERPTDFGETLYTWGFGEGPYVELPLLGPSTQRDAIGKFVDLFTNPVMYRLPDKEKYLARLAAIGSKLTERNLYSNTLDSILYESADSYAQARLLFLQNRRFELSGGINYDNTEIYDEIYGQ